MWVVLHFLALLTTMCLSTSSGVKVQADTNNDDWLHCKETKLRYVWQ